MLGLLQRYGFANPFEPIIRPVRIVTKRPLAGKLVVAITSLAQMGMHFGRSQVGVAAIRFQFQFQITVAVGLDNQLNVDRQLRIGDLTALLATVVAGLGSCTSIGSEPLLDAPFNDFASPAKTLLDATRVSLTQTMANFSQKLPARSVLELPRSRLQQFVRRKLRIRFQQQ